MSTPALEILDVSKRFGAHLANDDISLTLAKGEIVALLGENGAGKTTLMNILFGHYTPDRGTIRVEGAELPHGRPRAAIRAGVGMVHQHFSLAPNLSVLENVTAGTRSLWSPRSRTAAARDKLNRIARRFGLEIDPSVRVATLSVGEQQRVEILKALYGDARILVLDEPTAVLTAAEAQTLFATLKEMARQGLTIIFISHKLDEVMATADRVVVLRGGRLVAERAASGTTKAELAELMVGRAVARPRREAATPGETVLELVGVSLRQDGVDRLKVLDFRLRASEIVGVVGVSGNGQADLARLLGGLARPTVGTLLLFGREVETLDVAQAIRAGIGRIPEDRNHEGVIGEMPIWENAVLERLPQFSRRGIVDRKAGIEQARRIIERFDVRGGTPTSRIRLLSGGNVQKLILGRNLVEAPRILIAAQPSRGLDEGAVAGVHEHLLEARRAGTAILLISEDLDEVLALSDRIHAIVGSRLSPSVAGETASRSRLGLMMAGEWSVGEVVHAV